MKNFGFKKKLLLFLVGKVDPTAPPPPLSLPKSSYFITFKCLQIPAFQRVSVFDYGKCYIFFTVNWPKQDFIWPLVNFDCNYLKQFFYIRLGDC